MKKQTKQTNPKIKWKSLLLSIIILVVIILLPLPEGLPIAGKRALAVLAFAILLWVTEAVTYPVSAAFIITLLTILLGLSPSLDGSGGP
jgi:di/tricarboxylate transporter